MITKNDGNRITNIPPTPPTAVTTGGDKEEPNLIYPVMFMSSIGAVRINPEKASIFGGDTFEPELFEYDFNLNFTVFKKTKDGFFHLFNVINRTNFEGAVPQYNSLIVKDVVGEEAKNFMLHPLQAFKPFKRAILLFELRGYTILEFEKIVEDWKKSLEETVNKLEK